jgi:glutamate formiminotransferase/glutamate formiminotransferase/formiminotetrahydrofolate cyclodeaminase
MPPLIECVPNFSEGRDEPTLAALGSAITSVAGARLLDVHRDADHHRSVFTFVGGPDAVLEAAFRAVRVAVARIDLRAHRGQHPRMGAADVVPFVPLDGAPMQACVALARRLGLRIGEELGVPVFLYGRAATLPNRELVVTIRRPQFEGLGDLIGVDPHWEPDFGPARLHPTAGATAVGARAILVAYNVELASDDVAVARTIARTIRASSGGLPAVQAKGFLVRGRAQVSVNLLDVNATPPVVAFDAIVREAEKAGVQVVASEIVGLAPSRALPEQAQDRLKLTQPVDAKILERRLEEAGSRER